MSSGKIVQIIGAVIDVEFPRDQIPKVYDALQLDDVDLTLEVQQQLGDGIVRTIAMGPSEGLRRGLAVTGTGKGISVPVGAGTLGRIMDGAGPRTKKVRCKPRTTCRFTVPLPPMTSRPAARTFWSRASR